MSLQSFLGRLLPHSRGAADSVSNERRQLQMINTLGCDSSFLLKQDSISTAAFLQAPEIASAWKRVETMLARFVIPDDTGGVNPGDRRAVFHLIKHLRPQNVLEVGTHIGASTLHIAAALSLSAEETDITGHLTTVDLSDVNNEKTQPWRQYGTELSPAAMLAELGLQDFATFVNRNSLEFLTQSRNTYDLIFLDGDHSAATVYQEVPAAMKLLNPGGVILLHDYFPNLQPLWNNGSLISGPFLALERLRKEGCEFTVLPLGELPWPTKLGSSVTSLALLLGKGQVTGTTN